MKKKIWMLALFLLAGGSICQAQEASDEVVVVENETLHILDEEHSQVLMPAGNPSVENPSPDNSETVPAGNDFTEAAIQSILDRMTLEEKVAQMFIVTPDALTGVPGANQVGDSTRSAFQSVPVGGLIFFQENIVGAQQIMEMNQQLQACSLMRIGLPIFTGVDEEGGIVTRVAGRGIIETPIYESMYGLGGDVAAASAAGDNIGRYLHELGFNVDFAPVADIWSNPSNSVIGNRSFGTTADVVSPMVSAMVTGLQNNRVSATLKHFPGHGDTAEDSHSGMAFTYKTLDELRVSEFVPFTTGIHAGCDFIMMGHISAPNVTGGNEPATLSHMMVTEILREELGYEGIIITDAMNMGAISNNYSSADAAVKAVQAGVDMILMPADFGSARQGLLDAVQNGSISEDRIDESLSRIVRKKLNIS